MRKYYMRVSALVAATKSRCSCSFSDTPYLSVLLSSVTVINCTTHTTHTTHTACTTHAKNTPNTSQMSHTPHRLFAVVISVL